MQKNQPQPRQTSTALTTMSHSSEDECAPTALVADNARLRAPPAQAVGKALNASRIYLATDSDTGFVVRSRHSVPIRERRFYSVAKRVFDIAVGMPLLLVSLPLIAVAALAIRLESPGSPIFVQTRLGRHGRPFRLVKLRGMYIDSRIRFAQLYDYTNKANLDFCFHNEHDPRVTSVGRFLRRTSIDELPNFWNVVTGDMSLVGPRPEIPEVMNLYGSYRDEYLSVKPGVTCLSKCTGRDRLTKRETIEYDLQYVQKRSFGFDWLILWRTFRGVIMRRDVF